MEISCSSSRVGVFFFFFFFFLPCYGVEAASRRVFLHPPGGDKSSIANEVYRTSYHFQPPKNWINDPNGPMYFRGIYHLFYQCNPEAATWGHIHWAHSISANLIDWAPLELALLPNSRFDVSGCWSGSATILPAADTPVILYTSCDPAGRQAQSVAFPANLSDPLLRSWTKPDYNPLITPPAGVNSTSFRDPTTAWLGSDGLWRVAVGSETNVSGAALLYLSEDFVRWEKAGAPLHSVAGSGMWECPDFYPVRVEGTDGIDAAGGSGGVKHVLKISLAEAVADCYLLGRYDEARDVFVPDEAVEDHRMWPRYDYGKFYASKSFFDSKKKRRILWAWLNESDTEADDIAKGWAGIQIIPRTIWLDSSGKQLLQWPVEELQTLRRNEVHFQDIELQTSAIYEIEGVKASQADVEVNFELPSLEGAQPFDSTWTMDPPKLCRQEDAEVEGGIGPFGLLVLASENLEEHTAVFFRVYKDQSKFKVLMCSDQRRSTLGPEIDKQVYGTFLDMDLHNERNISLRTLIDHSVVESFGGGGRACITARVYPSFFLNSSTHLYAFNNGLGSVRASKIRAWDMARARMNLKVEQVAAEI